MKTESSIFPYSSIKRTGAHPSIRCPNCDGSTREVASPCKWRCDACGLNWYDTASDSGLWSHGTPCDGPYNAPPGGLLSPENEAAWEQSFRENLRAYEAKLRN